MPTPTLPHRLSLPGKATRVVNSEWARGYYADTSPPLSLNRFACLSTQLTRVKIINHTHHGQQSHSCVAGSSRHLSRISANIALSPATICMVCLHK